MPALSPDSVEVVELVRGRAFVVVRTRPSGVVVLDEAGKLVRGRPRLAAIARHLHAVRQVETLLTESQLERRLEQASRSTVFLGRVTATLSGKELRRVATTLGQDVELYRSRLITLTDERHRLAPATERTLRRMVSCLNTAARADRGVVRTARVVGATLADVSPASAVPTSRSSTRRSTVPTGPSSSGSSWRPPAREFRAFRHENVRLSRPLPSAAVR